MKIKLLLTLIILNFIGYSQVLDSLPNLSDEYFLIGDGDSLHIALDEVAVLPKHKFKSRTQAKYYYWFRKKVFKAYPYALMASQRLDSLNSELETIEKKSKRKKHIKKVQEYVENEFTEQLKKMSRTEGRVLIKLIHRQTGETAFDNIKELRSSWKAFWYNSTANLFSLSLKQEYNPVNVNEDYLIEDILQRAFIYERLEYQASKLDFNFIEILQSKKGDVNVDQYIEMFAKQRAKKKKQENKKK